jgi:glycosyltransferase involved in cell wall biosynthesis
VEGLSPVSAAQAAANPFYTADQQWAEPSADHTAKLMRQVYENRAEAKAKGERARRDIESEWTLERTADWISKRLAVNELAVAPPSPIHTSHTSHTAHTSTPLSFSWQAPLFDPSGYAEEARHFLLALDGAGHSVAAQSLRWGDRKAVLTAADERRLLAMTARTPARGGIHVSHIFPPSFTRRADADINVGRTMFETDRLPDAWVDACNRMEQIWVPGEFNRETFARAGVERDRLRIVPGAIDVRAYSEEVQPLAIDNARGFNFLSVFDWSLRKGWDVLLRAYVEEFSADEDVALILKTHSSLGYTIEEIGEAIVHYVGTKLGRDMSSTPEIILQDTNLPAHLMPNLYRAADCFVLPTRGEGWGRPFMEAMASGLPTIGTGWSGNTAFMNRDNSYLLDFKIVPVPDAACAEAEAFRGHRWAEPNHEHLKSLMREAYSNRPGAAAIGRAAREHIAANYCYEQVVKVIEQACAAQISLPAAA